MSHRSTFQNLTQNLKIVLKHVHSESLRLNASERPHMEELHNMEVKMQSYSQINSKTIQLQRHTNFKTCKNLKNLSLRLTKY